MSLDEKNNKVTCNGKEGVYFYKNESGFMFCFEKEKMDEYMEEAFLLIENGENVFVTGAAGTGKSSFLERIVERNEFKPKEFKKIIAVVSPTGVAAENVHGMTIHHMFGLQPILYLPGHKIKPNLYNLSSQQEEFVTCLEILIIDEVSMVRCDLLDAVDDILRHYRKIDKPFGGVQVVMFGDLYQLEPVVEDDEWEKLSEYYNQPYFFCSNVLKGVKWKVVELMKKYRQTDKQFMDLLDRVRLGNVTLNDLDLLRSRFDPDFKPDVIKFTTHKKEVKKYNEDKLQELPGENKLYIAKLHKADESKRWWDDFPTDYYLNLKVGARVMFLRNTDDYKNGTMGKIEDIYDDSVKVKIDNMEEPIIVERAKWSQYEYRIDKETKTIEAIETATFEQLPLKLAWAVTIHKSQGLTFDEVAIDVSKAFAYGQVYVALSRCRTLNGIHLTEPIYLQNILADTVVGEFLECKDDEGYVIIKDKYEGVQYEEQPLVLYVGKTTYDKIVAREKKDYSRFIKEENYDLAKKLFKYNQGKLCVNDIFSDDDYDDWEHIDAPGGHFPFLLRQYKTVVFVCRKTKEEVEAEILGRINVEYSDYGNDSDYGVCWKFNFRIGKILSK